MVTNGVTNEKVIAWLQKLACAFDKLSVVGKPQLALVAVQGPQAIDILKTTFPDTIASTILLSTNKRFRLTPSTQRF